MVKKKIGFGMLAVALALSLASCDSNDDTAPSNSDLAAFGFNTSADFETIRNSSPGFQRWTVLTHREDGEMERAWGVMGRGRTIEQFNAITYAVEAVFGDHVFDSGYGETFFIWGANDLWFLRHDPSGFHPQRVSMSCGRRSSAYFSGLRSGCKPKASKGGGVEYTCPCRLGACVASRGLENN